MIPIVTPAEMAAVDAAAPEPVEVLVERAGAAVAWCARRMLGGTYGARIVVVAGPGNNGADGRVAARRLAAWGSRVRVIDAGGVDALPDADLVVDAAYGTGLRRAYEPPAPSGPVLAVDIPSGVDGLTGGLVGSPWAAEHTITFQALKPGLVLGPGAALAGTISVAELGLDVSGATAHLVEEADVRGWLPQRSVDAHKWRHACWVVAGSPGMGGAAWLAAGGAARGGAGYVRLSTPGTRSSGPVEAVSHELPATGWVERMVDLDRFGAVVLGPGLGRTASTEADIRRFLGSVGTAVVVDADALAAIGRDPTRAGGRAGARILTPHDGEFERIMGSRPGPDRIEAARALARAASAVVLLKGPATVVAAPDGEARVVTSGDQRLASAGTGDVLAGLLGALLAGGAPPLDAAAAGAWLHGKAATATRVHGMVASDLLATLPEVLDATHVG